jgi:hypothetical protein
MRTQFTGLPPIQAPAKKRPQFAGLYSIQGPEEKVERRVEEIIKTEKRKNPNPLHRLQLIETGMVHSYKLQFIERDTGTIHLKKTSAKHSSAFVLTGDDTVNFSNEHYGAKLSKPTDEEKRKLKEWQTKHHNNMTNFDLTKREDLEQFEAHMNKLKQDSPDLAEAFTKIQQQSEKLMALFTPIFSDPTLKEQALSRAKDFFSKILNSDRHSEVHQEQL